MERDLFGGILRMVTAAVLALAGVATASAQTVDSGRNWRVHDIEGQALFQERGGEWRRINLGDVVHPGARVETGAKGRLVLVRPGDSLDAAPDTAFRVPEAERLVAGGPPTHIVQTKGTILFRIRTRPKSPFTVKTPYLAAVIKGTTFTVSVAPDNAALHVSKGLVQVMSLATGRTALVRSGQTAAVSRRGGAAMRLIGYSRRVFEDAPKDAATEEKVGRGPVRSVIPRTVGVTSIDVGETSRGLVSGAGAAKRVRGGHANGGAGAASQGNANGSSNTYNLSTVVGRLKNLRARRKGIGGWGPSGVSGTGPGNGNGNGNGNANGIGGGAPNGIGNTAAAGIGAGAAAGIGAAVSLGIAAANGPANAKDKK